MYHVVYSVLLIVHLLAAVALLGAITHQTWSAWAPAPAGTHSIVLSYRSVRPGLYVTAIIVLFLTTALLGAFLYPAYRISVLPFFYSHHLKDFGGFFELKEHFVAIGLGLLPFYWLLWKKVPPLEQGGLRKIVTAILAAVVWYSFLVGHVINNLKGFGS